MPKRITEGTLVRKVCRRLSERFADVDVRILPVPAYRSVFEGRMLETVVAKEGGERHRLHHGIGDRLGPDTAQRIVGVTARNMGMTDATVEALAKPLAACLRTGPGFEPLVQADWDGAVHVDVPVAMVDMGGRTHEMVRRLWEKDRKPRWVTAQQESQMEIDVELDTRRRDRLNRVLPLSIGGLSALRLSTMPEGREIAEGLCDRLAAAIDGVTSASDMTAISVSEAKFDHGGMRWRIKGRTFHLQEAVFPGGSIDGRVLSLDATLPEAVLAGCGGRRLGEVVSGVPLPDDTVIASAKTRRSGRPTALQLEARDVRIDEFTNKLR